MIIEHDDRDDLELIRGYQNGETASLSLLLKRRQAWLYNIAKRTVSDTRTAEDGLQEALLQIWKGAKSFRGDSQVTTWMYQIVVRCCIDVVRKENVRKADSLPEDSENFIGSTSGFESKIVNSLLIHGALAELEPPQKEILELIWLKELSHEEVAEHLDIPLGTVKSRASRAQARLKNLVQEILSIEGNHTASPSVKESEVKNVRVFRKRS